MRKVRLLKDSTGERYRAIEVSPGKWYVRSFLRSVSVHNRDSSKDSRNFSQWGERARLYSEEELSQDFSILAETETDPVPHGDWNMITFYD